LAEQSKQATARVRMILEEIQRATDAAVLVTEAGDEKVENGMFLAHRAGDIIVQLATTVQDASDVSQQIVEAEQQQNDAIEEMLDSMMEINQTTAEAVNAGQKSEAVAQRLNELTRHLKSMTEQYRLG
jgi:methyl-accepting chemotaxis protein